MTKKALIVEDNDACREALANLLTGNGWEVATAVNGEHAVRKLAGERYSLVVLDLALPLLTGWQVLDAMKLSRDETPVLLTTAMSGQDASAYPNVARVFTKPYEAAEVVSAAEALGA